MPIITPVITASSAYIQPSIDAKTKRPPVDARGTAAEGRGDTTSYGAADKAGRDNSKGRRCRKRKGSF